MPCSFPDFKPEIRKWVDANFSHASEILDVGPGVGTFAALLRPPYMNLDAIEVHEPYIGKFNLPLLYRQVLVGDVRTFTPPCSYDLVIMGDVLEHLTVKDAEEVLRHFLNGMAADVLVQVPYCLVREKHEIEAMIHRQGDLTERLFLERYPQFRTLHTNHRCGVFVA